MDLFDLFHCLDYLYTVIICQFKNLLKILQTIANQSACYSTEELKQQCVLKSMAKP